MENKNFKVNNDSQEYVMPDECEKSEQELEKISDETIKAHYAFVNFLIIVLILLTSAVAFIVMTSKDKADIAENPLTLKTFVSGRFSDNIQKNYIKNLPFPYELKNTQSRINFLYGIGNKVTTVKKHKEIILLSDEDIEQEKQQVKQNIEKALNSDSESSQKPEETTAKKTSETKKTVDNDQKTETTVQRKTTEQTKEVTSQQTTSLTTTNNNAPETMHIETEPPVDDDGEDF